MSNDAAVENERLRVQLGRAIQLLKQNTGLLCESGNLNNYRNLSDEELGKAWVETARHTAEFLNEIEGVLAVTPADGATGSCVNGERERGPA